MSVAYICEHWYSLWVKGLVIFSSLYALILVTFIYVVVIFSWPHFPLSKNPLLDLQGWHEAAQVAKQELTKLPASDKNVYLFVPNWSLATRLAWYSQRPVKISSLDKQAQTALWYGKAKKGDNGLVVVPYPFTSPAAVGTRAGEFKRCRLLKKLLVRKQGYVVNQFRYYACYDYL